MQVNTFSTLHICLPWCPLPPSITSHPLEKEITDIIMRVNRSHGQNEREIYKL